MEPQKSRSAHLQRDTAVLGILLVGVCLYFVMSKGQLVQQTASNPTVVPTVLSVPLRTLIPSATPTDTNTATPTTTPTEAPTATATPTLSASDLAQTKIANITETSAAKTATRIQNNLDLTATFEEAVYERTALANSIVSTRTFIQSFKPIIRGELVSYADRHRGELVVIQGSIIDTPNSTDLEVWISGSFDVVYIKCKYPYSGIYKNDWIKIYGTVDGYFGSIAHWPVLKDAVVIKQ